MNWSELSGMFAGAFAKYGTLVIQSVTDILSSVLYFKIGPLPFATIWILIGFCFFTMRLRLLPFRLLGHTIDIIKGKYNKSTDVGNFTHKEAICTAALGTVGLGSVAGVAVAVVAGGPGAIVWMAIVGLLGVSVKFAEVTMAHKHRHVNSKTGEVSGGPLMYIQESCKGKWKPLGKAMAIFYGVALLGISLTSSNMFQSNQSMVVLKDSFAFIDQYSQFFAVGVTALVGVVALGGAGFIGKLGTMIVPFMSLVYLLLALIVIFADSKSILGAFSVMFTEAFKYNSVKWGMIGAIVAGATRSIYTTESGGGTSGMAHAPARTSEPVREGLTAAVEAFIPMLVSLITGLAIVVTGVYKTQDGFGGILLTKAAFATVSPWFPQLLSVSIFFIAITTVMAWSYYGRLAWVAVFGNRGVNLFIVLFLCSTYYGMISTSQGVILQLADCLWLGATIPNLLALYIMEKDLHGETMRYYNKLKAGEF